VLIISMSKKISLAVPDDFRKSGLTAGGAWQYFSSAIFWTALIVLAMLPIAVTSILPLTDLGGHLGRYAVQIAPGDPIYARWYTFTWGLIPNLGVDLLMQVFAPGFGLERSLRYVVLAIPMLQAAGMIALSRAAHGKVTPMALFALPLAYSYPFLFGFLNFTLGEGLALCAAALWIWLDRRQQGLAWTLAFAPIAVVLWVCHLAAWALLAIFAFSSVWQRARLHCTDLRGAVRTMVVALWPLCVPLVAKMIWARSGNGAQGLNITYDLPAKLSIFIMPFRDRWLVWDVASAFVVLGLIGWSWRSRKWQLDPVLLRAGMLIGLGYAVSPSGMLGLWYIDTRLVPILLITLLLAARPGIAMTRSVRDTVVIAGTVFVLLRLASNAQSLHLSDQSWQRELAMLDRVPAGSNMVTLVVESSDKQHDWLRERRQHLSGFALARRHIFSNDQWEVPNGQLLRVVNQTVGPFRIDPAQRVHTGSPGDVTLDDIVDCVPPTIPYLWIVAAPQGFRNAGWQQIDGVDDVALYRPNNAPGRVQSNCAIEPKTGKWLFTTASN